MNSRQELQKYGCSLKKQFYAGGEPVLGFGGVVDEETVSTALYYQKRFGTASYRPKLNSYLCVQFMHKVFDQYGELLECVARCLVFAHPSTC